MKNKIIQKKQEIIQNISKEAQAKYGIKSTPSFVVNGVLLSGAQPYGDLKKIINSALKKSK